MIHRKLLPGANGEPRAGGPPVLPDPLVGGKSQEAQPRGRRINLVVTCTSRKRQPPHPDLTIRRAADISGRDPWRAWLDRLEQVEAPVNAAQDLYLGQHWLLARELADEPGQDVELVLWLCSAGYGLIRPDAPVKSYSAVFSPGSADAVSRLMPALDYRQATRLWWSGLAEWQGPLLGAPRTLAAVAEADPDAVIVLAVSPPYLTACGDDLANAQRAIADPDRLMLVCAGSNGATASGLRSLPLDGRAVGFLGGTMGTLGLRFVRHLLREYDWDNLRGSYLSPRLDRWLANLAPRRLPVRSRQSDGEVARFIRQRLVADPRGSATRLLREYRDQGQACEQGRFRTIYWTARERVDVG